jgi:hypothetical protein
MLNFQFSNASQLQFNSKFGDSEKKGFWKTEFWATGDFRYSPSIFNESTTQFDSDDSIISIKYDLFSQGTKLQILEKNIKIFSYFSHN